MLTRLPLGTLCFCKTVSFWQNSIFHVDEFTIGYLCFVEQHLSGKTVYFMLTSLPLGTYVFVKRHLSGKTASFILTSLPLGTYVYQHLLNWRVYHIECLSFVEQHLSHWQNIIFRIDFTSLTLITYVLVKQHLSCWRVFRWVPNSMFVVKTASL